jgi:putative membrane protein
MIRTDNAFSDAIEHAVRQAEKGTTAELVVVVAARSGSYLDVALAIGAAVSMLVFAGALFAPAVFHPVAVALEVPLAFALAAWLSHRTPGLLRRLTPVRRMTEQVERAASARFLEEAVHGTRSRTGLLVYLSLLEERAVLIADLGLQGLVPKAAWQGVRWSETGDRSGPRDQAGVIRGIGEIGEILRLHAPGDDRDGNESPDAPRILA